MFQVNLATLIATLKDQLLPKSELKLDENGLGATYKGLVVVSDVSLSHYSDSKTLSRRVFVALCGNVNVFVAIEPQDKRWGSIADIPLHAWENTSNHDSCWRSDGLQILTSLYFSFAEELNSQLKKKLAPRDFSNYSNLDLFKPWFFVKMRHELRPGEHYLRQLTLIEPWPT